MRTSPDPEYDFNKRLRRAYESTYLQPSRSAHFPISCPCSIKGLLEYTAGQSTLAFPIQSFVMHRQWIELMASRELEDHGSGADEETACFGGTYQTRSVVFSSSSTLSSSSLFPRPPACSPPPPFRLPRSRHPPRSLDPLFPIWSFLCGHRPDCLRALFVILSSWTYVMRQAVYPQKWKDVLDNWERR